MSEFPSNSHKAKEAPAKQEPKKVDKVVEGKVVRRKKTLGKRMAETFIGGDINSVKQYLMFDVAIPAAKDMISDVISSGIERMLFGESRGPSRRGPRPGGHNGYVSYNRFAPNQSSPMRREETRPMSRRSRTTHEFDEILLATRHEAEEVIDRLFDIVSRYEQATVSDLYELVGVTPSFTDEKWGWTDIRGAGVTRTKAGYLLDLPRPENLD